MMICTHNPMLAFVFVPPPVEASKRIAKVAK